MISYSIHTLFSLTLTPVLFAPLQLSKQKKTILIFLGRKNIGGGGISPPLPTYANDRLFMSSFKHYTSFWQNVSIHFMKPLPENIT